MILGGLIHLVTTVASDIHKAVRFGAMRITCAVAGHRMRKLSSSRTYICDRCSSITGY